MTAVIRLGLPFALYTLGMPDDDELSLEASLLHHSIESNGLHEERGDALLTLGTCL